MLFLGHRRRRHGYDRVKGNRGNCRGVLCPFRRLLFRRCPGSVTGPWSRYGHDPDARGIGTMRYPRLVPKDEECPKSLAARTLTKLYNERPTWLDLAHKKLDAAVA